MSLVVLGFLSACSAVYPITDQGRTAQGYLQFEVEPVSAEVFIDAEYQGLISGWTDQTIAVPVGLRQVELRATGFISQRFDIAVDAHELVTLEVRLEPELEELALNDGG